MSIPAGWTTQLGEGVRAYCHKCDRSYATLAEFQAQHDNGRCLPDRKPVPKRERAK